MTPKKRRNAPRVPQEEAYTLKNLDQIRILADPLRIRILEAFSQERTTKQVAELLGEKPTKLYHLGNPRQAPRDRPVGGRAGEDAAGGQDDAGQARYRLTLAYYPLRKS